MASLVLVIKGSGVTEMKQASSVGHVAINDIVNYLHSLASGSNKGTVYAQSAAADPVAASGTITCASAAAADTVTICKTVMTASATPSGESQWDQSGTDTADAASLAAKINAHSVLSKLVSATSAAGVVTVTALTRGENCNQFALTSSNGTRLAVTGSGYLSGGTGGATDTPSSWAFGQ